MSSNESTEFNQPYEDNQEYDYSTPYDESHNIIDYTQTYIEIEEDHHQQQQLEPPNNYHEHDKEEHKSKRKKLSDSTTISSAPIIYAEPVPTTITPILPKTFDIPANNNLLNVQFDSMGAVPYPQGYTQTQSSLDIAEAQENLEYNSYDREKERQAYIASSNPSTFQDIKKEQVRIIRSGGGQIWEDATLNDWDPKDFRIFVGDLGRDVSDDALTRAFQKYPSMQKARIVRDRKTLRTKGYGFVSFSDPTDFVKAMKEMNGKFVGSRPVKLSKSTWDDRTLTTKELKTATGSTRIPNKKDQKAIIFDK